MDLSTLSDADLLSAIQSPTPPQAPGSDLSKLSDADLLKAIQKPAAPSSLKGLAKAVGVGAAEGALGLAGAPADIANLAAKGIDYLKGSNLQQYTQPVAEKIGGAGLQKAVESQTGPFYQPQGMLEQGGNILAQFLPAMIGGPETLATKLMTRVALPAAGSELAGAATQGTPLEGPARVTGAVLGAASPLAISRAISPTTIDAANAAAINRLSQAGVDLTAGQKAGSRVLKYGESELGDAFGAGGKATAATEKQAEQFTSAVLNKIPVTAGEKRLTQEVFDKALTDNSAKFEAAVQANPVIRVANDFTVPINNIARDFEAIHGEGSAPVLSKMAERINSVVTQTPAGAVMPGAAYQGLQSDLAKFARQASSNGYLRQALYDMREQLNNAVAGGLAGPSGRLFNEARNEFRKLLVLERLASSTTESANKGLITPAALANAEKAVYSRRTNARGTGPFSQLASAGNAIMKPLPQSGTAPRAAVHALPSIVGAGLGFGGGLGAIPSILGGIAGPALAGRAIFSRPVQAYLSNQAAVPLRNIPITRNLLTSGVLGFTGPNYP